MNLQALPVTTIIDISKRAGVSVATVSRALSDPDRVRPQTREKIRLVIEELGYAPNALARGLRQMRSKTVIVVVPQIQNPFFSGVIQGVENVAHDNGFRILLGETQGKQERLDHYAAMVSGRVADGLILLGSLLPSGVSPDRGTDSTLPLVLACERFDQLPCPHVAIDNEYAAYEAVSHLIAIGRMRIATITGPAGNTLSEDRLVGYRNALLQGGRAADERLVMQGDFSVASGAAAMASLLDLPSTPDAVFCANDEMALGAHYTIRRSGIRIPEDIAIIGFDDIRFSRFVDPPLSTVGQPTATIGETSMRLMLQLLAGELAGAHEVVLPHEIIIRGSTQPG